MKFLIIIIIFLSSHAQAQHCPWDCSGLLVLQSDLSPAELQQLKPVVVDENKTAVIDTIYGTSMRTWDTAYVLPFAQFQQYRTARIAEHRWYAYDTVYRFAEGYLVAKLNYCKYAHSGRKLFVRFTLPSTGKDPVYKYIPIEGKDLLHLHDYSIQLNRHDTATIRREIGPKIFMLRRSDIGLP